MGIEDISATSLECRALVLWGTNLQSTVGARLTRTQSGFYEKLPIKIQGIIVGLLLSDGWMTFANSRSKNARLGFTQSLANSGYLWFVFNTLSHYCSSYPHFREGSRKGNQYFALQFFTRTLPCFTELHSLFYVNNVKIIPNNIYELLTPVALAHMIMGDGSSQRHGIIICTNSYTLPDVIRLMNVLMIRYRLECNLRIKKRDNKKIQKEYTIYIQQSSMPLLRTIITPYLHPSMLYKLGL
jgi:hypothetical protein